MLYYLDLATAAVLDVVFPRWPPQWTRVGTLRHDRMVARMEQDLLARWSP